MDEKGKRTRKEQPHEYETPSLAALEAEVGRPYSYRFTKRVWDRGRPYVSVVVTLTRQSTIFGHEAVYLVEARFAPTSPRTVDGRVSPHLGSRQRAVGADHLGGLVALVRTTLADAGWRRIPSGAGPSPDPRTLELWQAPEGEALDRQAARRSERLVLHARVKEAVDRVLDGDGMSGAEFREVPVGKQMWQVWAEPRGGGVKVTAGPETEGDHPFLDRHLREIAAAESLRPQADSPEDMCECGDYRRDHEEGGGRCLKAHELGACDRFELFARKGSGRAALAEELDLEGQP